ncbi:hypothetical protein FRC10_003393 [Ceratobasidium sp. 414]|nr:hypothetical protein FRC10_003393 [Ceratobasidium sp. 414]
MFGTLIAILALAGYANGHGFITDIRGANGKTSNGFGVGVAPFKPGDQGPTSVINGAPIGCGRGVAVGQIDVAADLEAAVRAGLPTADASGSISMNWRQVNAGADGGGPGTALIDVTGTGNNFKPVTISKNFGDGGADSDNPMTIAIPAGTICSGGSTANVCLLRVSNPPGFGSCFAIALSGSSGGAVSNSSSAVEASTSAIAISSTTAVVTTNTISKSTSVSTPSVVATSTPAVAETSATTPTVVSSSSAAQCAVTPTITVTVTPAVAASSTPCPTDPITITVTRGSTAAATAKAVKAGKKHHKVNSAVHLRPRGVSLDFFIESERVLN